MVGEIYWAQSAGLDPPGPRVRQIGSGRSSSAIRIDLFLMVARRSYGSAGLDLLDSIYRTQSAAPDLPHYNNKLAELQRPENLP